MATTEKFYTEIDYSTHTIVDTYISTDVFKDEMKKLNKEKQRLCRLQKKHNWQSRVKRRR